MSSEENHIPQRFQLGKLDKQTEALFDLAFGPGEWVRFPKRLLRSKLHLRQIIMLAFMIDRHFQWKTRATKRKKEYDGWFSCTTELLAKELAMVRGHQQRELASLRDAGLIYLGRKGKFAKRRYIALHIEAIVALVTAPGEYDPSEWR